MSFAGSKLCSLLQVITLRRQFSVFSDLKCTFKSGISLDKIYPNSSLDITKRQTINMSNTSNDKFSGYIPMKDLIMKTSRSSGPGGQNINKSETKVELRFHAETAEWIPQETREKFLVTYKNYLTKDGFFIIKSDRTRSQHLNIADALQKLRDAIWKLEKTDYRIKEVSEEVIQKRLQKAARERIKIKRMRSERKAISRGPTIHDL